VQERLGRRILLENVSSYITFKVSEMPEWEFLSEVARRADCGILLDINNVCVSANNHGFDPLEYIDAIAGERVGQIHLAGHSRVGALLLDTHDARVSLGTWDLYRRFLEQHGPRPTLVEWDDRLPPLRDLILEVERARRVEHETLREAAHHA
jgi:uncharacterized protein (UPF0276 family)